MPMKRKSLKVRGYAKILILFFFYQIQALRVYKKILNPVNHCSHVFSPLYLHIRLQAIDNLTTDQSKMSYTYLACLWLLAYNFQSI